MDSGWRLGLCLVVGIYWCLVVNPSPDKMIIVGGYGGWQALNIVDECVIV